MRGLQALPNKLFLQMSRLQRLLLQNNQLPQLPPNIGALAHLTELDLSGNQLTALPMTFSRLQQLESACRA